MHDNCHMKLVMQVFEIAKALLLTLGIFYVCYIAFSILGIHPRNSPEDTPKIAIFESEDNFLQSIGASFWSSPKQPIPTTLAGFFSKHHFWYPFVKFPGGKHTNEPEKKTNEPSESRERSL